MKRLSDWRPRLVAYLVKAAGIPFSFGRHDCALFAAESVQAMTGFDLASDWRGRYRTERGGLRVLRAAGYSTHVDLAAAHFPEQPIAMARPGDLAEIAVPGAINALGVLQGSAIYVLRPEGLGTVSRIAGLRSWRVG